MKERQEGRVCSYALHMIRRRHASAGAQAGLIAQMSVGHNSQPKFNGADTPLVCRLRASCPRARCATVASACIQRLFITQRTY